ncbi:MAG: NAD-dependent DNA ligase LigA [Eubacteriales bacterium]
MSETERLMRDLEKQISFHQKKYHDEDSPVISDYEYDMLFKRLLELEESNPSLASPVSPTKRVGGHVAERFEKSRHPVRLGSLNDVFDYSGVFDFYKKVKNLYPDEDFVVEKKIDGLSVSLEYIDGVFTKGVTRGDGLVGEVVTENLKTLRTLPLMLSFPLPRLIVRGEVYMPKNVFASLNEKREEEGLPPFANPRNAAAGSLRQLNSKLCAERRLEVFVFNVQLCESEIPKTHGESLSYLQSLGFSVSPGFCVCGSYEQIEEKIKEIGKSRDILPFDIDGAVVKVNSLSRRLEMGEVGVVPRWAVAFKYPPIEEKTTVTGIVLGVGRTGVITPKAILKPVYISGSTVSAAALHNIDFINEKDIRVGDTVFIRKAGDIIPEIVSVVLSERPDGAVPFEMPKTCPSCGEKITRENGEAAYRCTNSSCPDQLERNIIHFIGRDAMDIETLGPATVRRFIEEGIISSPSDLFALDREKIAGLEGLGEKSAENIIASAEKSKSKPLSRLIAALGIRHVGEKAAKAVAERFVTMESLMSAGKDSLMSVPDIGPESAESITAFFSVEKNRLTIDKLKALGVNMTEPVEKKGRSLAGMTVVVTGTLETLTRGEAESLVEKNGGKSAGSVSKKTSLLVFGENAGSKLEKARALGIKIIDETEFLSLIKGE